MSLLARHLPIQFEAGFLGTMQLRGTEGFQTPRSVIKVKSEDIKLGKVESKLKKGRKGKRKKSRLGPYGRYLF